jgi:PAS domain S-box-containing protein
LIAIEQGGSAVSTPSGESNFGVGPDAKRYLQWSIVLRPSDQSEHDYQRDLRFVLGAVLAGIWEVDFVAERLIWSPEMYWLHGWSPESLRLETYFDQLVHPEDRELVVSTLLNMAAGLDPQRPIDLEYRIVRPDGKTVVWISALGSIELDESGRPSRAVGIARDISLRKRVETAQRDADQFIARIAEVAPTLIYVYDLAMGRRVYNNGWLPEALGYGADYDIDVMAFMDRVLHPEDRERMAAYRRSHAKLADGVISQMEYRARHIDGSWRWLLSRNLVFARNADGSVRQLIGTTTDITTAKRTEEELRRLNAELERRVSERTADLQAANRELEAFAYSISHDLRGPLRAISGFSNAVLDTCGEQLDPSGRRYLSLVTAGVKRMTDMIEGLLALSRTTRNELLLGRVDLSAMAGEIFADLQHAEPNRRVDILIIREAEVIGDARLLRIALDNLLGNAWKYTSRCEGARLEFGMQTLQGESIYFVRDNGVGFDMANANALFMPFQRLHPGGQFEGTGIGLATVQRIIHRHGGRIWAQSAPDQGATFYFTLPNVATDDASTRSRTTSLQAS